MLIKTVCGLRRKFQMSNKTNNRVLLLNSALSLFTRYQTFIRQSFSQQIKSQWSESAQQAFVANKIINLILSPPHLSKYTDISLKYKIITEQYSNDFITVEEHVKNKVL